MTPRHSLYILYISLIGMLQAACSQPGMPAEADSPVQSPIVPDSATIQALASGHEYVDLGICHGLRWATMNIGASKPEEPGLHFSWGATETGGFDPKCSPFGEPINKYVVRNDNGFHRDDMESLIVDGRTALEPCDDAAHTHWRGAWRMPFADELDSLMLHCRWEPDTLNGTAGYRVYATRRGFEGRSIFLPFTGAWSQLSFVRQNSGVFLWSKNLGINPDASIGLLASAELLTRTFYYRYQGQAIRPVFLPNELQVEQVIMDSTSLKLQLNGQGCKLSATAMPTNATRPKLYWHSSNYSIASVDSSGFVTPCGPGWCYITATTTDGTSLSASCRVRVFEATPPNHPCLDLGICHHLRWATENIGSSSSQPHGQLLTWTEADSLNWGDHWRLPTNAELDSLRTKCRWQWTLQDGVPGYRVSGKTRGYENHAIFLPILPSAPYGLYWSSSATSILSGAHSALAIIDQMPLWSYRPDTCRILVRMVYSLD